MSSNTINHEIIYSVNLNILSNLTIRGILYDIK